MVVMSSGVETSLVFASDARRFGSAALHPPLSAAAHKPGCLWKAWHRRRAFPSSLTLAEIRDPSTSLGMTRETYFAALAAESLGNTPLRSGLEHRVVRVIFETA